MLRSVTDDLSVLRKEAAAEEQRRADPLWLRGVKYTFVTAIEGCVDVAQHLCASEGWGPPRDNGDAVKLLGRHGVLDGALAERLRRAVGFRNVLVHEYVDVDDHIVVSRLDDPSDLEAFGAAVVEWVSAQRG
ncbi:MAG: type VII toxin-antitoxin system HepT family RNase toxin [Pseudonocardia sp.]